MRKKFHFIGIGGIGMSALARLYLDRGAEISGSDLRRTNLTEDLTESGAKIYYGHSSEHIGQDTDAVIVSTSIAKDNPEVRRAEELLIPVLPRVLFLKKSFGLFPLTIGVTGTHGKTTTSGLVSHVFWKLGLEPTALLGGESRSFSSNARSGLGDILVAEVDESDGYFRGLYTDIAIITNIEKEHMEHYSGFSEICESYKEFISHVPENGKIIYNTDDPILKELVISSEKPSISFGMSAEAVFSCRNIASHKETMFDLYFQGNLLGKVKSRLVGEYNVMNIMAAIACAWSQGLGPKEIIEAVSSFKGMLRRFERVSEGSGVEIFEDYAHHPTEIRAVIKAAKNYSKGRVITVFQPHRYTRTLSLMSDFQSCFQGTDIFFLTDIYPASEKPIEGVTSEVLFDQMDKKDFSHAEVTEKSNVPLKVAEVAEKDDIVLVLGAGDIRDIAEDIGGSVKEKKTFREIV